MHTACTVPLWRETVLEQWQESENPSLLVTCRGKVKCRPSAKLSPGVYCLDWHQLPPGFVNRQSSCYTNSVFECLMYIPAFQALLLEIDNASEQEGNSKCNK